MHPDLAGFFAERLISGIERKQLERLLQETIVIRSLNCISTGTPEVTKSEVVISIENRIIRVSI